MRAFYVVLFAIILSSAVDCREGSFDWAEVDKGLTMFGIIKDNDKNPAEIVILKSLDTIKNIFGDPRVKLAVQSLAIGTAIIPIVGTLTGMVSSLVGLLESESEWKKEFTLKLLDVVDKSHATNDLKDMRSVLESIENRLPNLNATVTGERMITPENRGEIAGFATDIFTRLEEMINTFASYDSNYRRYPLVGAPFLSGLSTLIVSIEPILQILLEEASSAKLSCYMRNTILDFMDYLLSARYEKTNLDLWKTKKIRTLPYNEKGYTTKQQLDCGECTSEDKAKDLCIIDEFNLKTYSAFQYDHPCEADYIAHLRHSMETRFPLELLNGLCNRPRGEPTGSSINS